MKEVQEKSRQYIWALAVACGADEKSAHEIAGGIMAEMQSIVNLPWDRTREEQHDERVRDRIQEIGARIVKTDNHSLAYWIGTRIICLLQAIHPNSSNFRRVSNFVQYYLGPENSQRFVEALAQS